MTYTLTDLFCGAGGSSSGAELVHGVKTVMAANHWAKAIATHNHNLPHAAHDCADISQVDPRRYPPTDLLWASPECTNHSQAKGVRDADKIPDLFDETLEDSAAERSRATMWDVIRFLEAGVLRGRPYLGFVVENVVEVNKWLPYRAWRVAIESLDYCFHPVYLNSMYAQAGGPGAAQSRNRWFGVGHRKSLGRCPDLRRWTRPDATCERCGRTGKPVQAWKRLDRQWGVYGTHGQYVWACPTPACRGQRLYPRVLPAATVIDFTREGVRIRDRAQPLADKTMARIRAGIAANARPMLVPTGGTWRTQPTPVDEPMPTRTTRENDGLAVPPLPAELVVPPMVVALEGRATVAHVRPVDQPLRTQTGRHQDGLLVPMRNHGIARPIATHPLPTVTAAGNHHGLLTWPQLLVPYYRTGTARPVDQPTGTLSTIDRYGILDPETGPVIDALDCTFRMLEPDEIAGGMAFAPSYEILGTRRERVRQAGNAVTPPAARDLIAALVEAISGQEPTFRPQPHRAEFELAAGAA
ncbi:DNA cytosine methyltransferase [Catenuloplanes indicus]|uniref:DNA (cytosine-5-)-methyltransferase n=1 Tax=Catenuloplanes indicus TaxID=137267 RepID=A0AAE4AY37_9ACTN|nr:DNA cytosine methyltransferase [Catenuloplanes indicus]MDQ0366857.1 DNA (cytosine-5)-methyltransferase 1 [Catenuloplanes indicus]